MLRTLSSLTEWLEEHREFIGILALATSFRLFTVLLLNHQGGYIYDGHLFYDYQYYRRIGELWLQGYYPSIDYWMEYPPLFTWTIIGVYRLSLLLPAMRDPIFSFHHFLGTFLALVDAANLALIYIIQLRLGGRITAVRSVWMYALLFWPLYVMVGWLDPLPLLFLLTGVYALITNRPILAGAALGLGFMTKIIPAVIAPVALRAFGRWRQVAAFAVAGGVAVGLVSAPFLVAGPEMFFAGFQAALSRASWLSIWALMEGYYDVGVVASLETHFDAATAGFLSHPTSLPWPIINGVFLAVYALALTKVQRCSPRATVAFAGLAISLLFIFSKGYSDQFIVYLLPFVVLLLPNGWGVVCALVLMVTTTLQSPLYLQLFQDELYATWTAIGLRTLLWVVLCIVFFVQATGFSTAWLDWARDRLAMPATVAAALLVIGMAWPLLGTYVKNRGEYYDLGQYLRPLAAADQGVVLSNRDLISYVYPYIDGSALYVLPEDWQRDETQARAALSSFAAGRSQVWLVLDYSRGEDARHGFLERTLNSYGAKPTNRWFDTFRLVGYAAITTAERRAWQPANTTFSGTIRLADYSVPASVDDGRPFRVMMRWSTVTAADADYKVFVHFVSPQGRIVAQGDKVLTRLGAGTTTWQPGDEAFDATDVLVPIGTAPGDYEMLAGLYRADTGKRLQLDDGRDSLSLGKVRVTRAAPQQSPRTSGKPTDFEGELRVLGFAVEGKPRAGDTLGLAIFLQARGRPPADYRLSVGLVRDGAVVAQSDGLSGGEDYPSSRWQSGEIVREFRQTVVGEPGTYEVGVKVTGKDDAPVPPVRGARTISGGWVVLPGKVVVEK